jgi:hypothetical protein
LLLCCHCLGQNGDGRLGPDELGALMAQIGGDAALMMQELDEDKSGAIEQVRSLSLASPPSLLRRSRSILPTSVCVPACV